MSFIPEFQNFYFDYRFLRYTSKIGERFDPSRGEIKVGFSVLLGIHVKCLLKLFNFIFIFADKI